jgi:thiosulfate dehydrogenase [quinone] large subunit
MKESKIYTPMQIYVLVALRLLIGWHLLYEGFSKLLISNWSSSGFLNESKWILSGFSHWIVSHPGILNAVDFLNTWGLIAIGTGLILGLFTKAAAISGAILLFIYYLNNPPLIGLEYSVPSEGSYLIISKTLIESLALVALAVFPSGYFAGLDMLVSRFRNRNNKIEEKYNGKRKRPSNAV